MSEETNEEGKGPELESMANAPESAAASGNDASSKPLQDESGSSEEVIDLSESAGESVASASSLEHTSDALYIVREGNYLLELAEVLEEGAIELKEEVE